MSRAQSAPIRIALAASALASGALAFLACGDDTEGTGGAGGAAACSPDAQTGCEAGFVCEEVEGASSLFETMGKYP